MGVFKPGTDFPPANKGKIYEEGKIGSCPNRGLSQKRVEDRQMGSDKKRF